MIGKELFKGALGQRYYHLSQISVVSMSFRGRAKEEIQDKVLTKRSMGFRAEE